MYAARYLGKEDQKGGPGGPAYPKGLRIIGMRLGKNLSRFGRILVKLWRLPLWLQEIVRDDAWSTGYLPWRRKGGGWYWRNQVLFSPWRWWFERSMLDRWASVVVVAN